MPADQSNSTPDPETSAPLEAVIKEQIDKEVDAAFPAAPADGSQSASAGQGPAHALRAEDDAASDAEAQKVLLDEVAAQEAARPSPAAVIPSPSGEGGPGEKRTGEGLRPEPVASKEESPADPLAAGRAASAEAVSAAEREGLIEKPPQAEAQPAPKAGTRAEKSPATTDQPAAGRKKGPTLAAVLHRAGSLLATILELADRPFAWVDSEARNVLGVTGLVILGVSVALIVLRLRSIL